MAKPFKSFRFMKPADDPGSGGGAGGTPPGGDPQTFSREYVSELRNENKGLRLRASALETEKTALQEKVTAAEATAAAAQGKIDAAEQASNDRIIRAELKAAAVKAGMIDMDGLKLADLSTVKLNDKGEVEGADALMESMKTAKPYMFGATGTTTQTAPPPPNNPPALKLAKDMTKEEYAAAKAELIKK